MSHTMLQHVDRDEKRMHSRWQIWFQWVLANALGEAVGLGGTLLVGTILLLNAERVLGSLAAAAFAIAAGTCIEGTVVGTAQWLVLRRPLPALKWRAWVLVTALGAGIAWTLGMLPSTFLFTGSETGTAASAAEMSDMMIYGLAAVMGFVLGPVLGTPQWVVLRRHVQRAGWWILANSVAWACGMVVVFMGTNFIPSKGVDLRVGLMLALFLVAAGAVVGAVHGLVLIWLLEFPRVRKSSKQEARAVPSLA